MAVCLLWLAVLGLIVLKTAPLYGQSAKHKPPAAICKEDSRHKARNGDGFGLSGERLPKKQPRSSGKAIAENPRYWYLYFFRTSAPRGN